MPAYTQPARLRGNLASSVGLCVAVTDGGRLAAFDPMAADPAAIAVAVSLPEVLSLEDGDVVMRVRMNASAAGPEMDETFELEVAEGDATQAGLPQPGRGRHVQIVRIAEQDFARLTVLQQAARVRRGSGARGGGSLQVAIHGGCRSGPVPPGPLLADLYMKIEAQGPYFLTLRDVDLAAAIGSGAAVDAIRFCAAPPR